MLLCASGIAIAVTIDQTNGGYGGVQQALAHGVPLVVAGDAGEVLDASSTRRSYELQMMAWGSV